MRINDISAAARLAARLSAICKIIASVRGGVSELTLLTPGAEHVVVGIGLPQALASLEHERESVIEKLHEIGVEVEAPCG